jgi:hypothetical protein
LIIAAVETAAVLVAVRLRADLPLGHPNEKNAEAFLSCGTL